MFPVVALQLLLAAALADDPRFSEARARFVALDYEGALVLFDALAAEPDAARDPLHPTLLVWTGAARALLGDEGAARLAFEAALLKDRRVDITFDTSPKVRALFAEVRARLPAPPPTATPDTVEHVEHPVEPTGTITSTAPPDAAASPSVVGVEPVGSGPVEPVEQGAPGRGPLWLAGVSGAGVVGGVGLVVAGLAAVDVQQKMQVASDPQTAQRSAQTLVDEANVALVVAGIAGGVGVALVGVATALVVMP